MGFLWYIIIGIAAGFLAGKIMRGGGFRYYRQPDYGNSRSHSGTMDRFVV